MDYERLGVFYLGRAYDLAAGSIRPEPVLYDSRDLTTHAVCVGMTGSGKTGLCLALLEEAAIDGVPVIALDPKGDIGNLALTFPHLRPDDFRPWIDEDEARRKGVSPDQLAADTADHWRKGLTDWDQSPERIQRFRDAAEVAIYTPGSTAGRPLSVLRSFHAPAKAILDDPEAFREQIQATASGLLAFMGIDADPMASREALLISRLLDDAWTKGRDLDLEALLHGIQKPPFDKVGLIDVESFFPAKDRFALAMKLNALIASPGFAAWTAGDPLDIGKLLYSAEGRKPRISILSIAHLNDAERMSFVTILLNEVVSWMRTQPGTSSLRAILYMDEIFGYFPPSASPPSKRPMLTLLKQARAFGLGVVLATQNPVDLDYKGLANTGTWFLGRLQTERDKARVLDGLEGTSAGAGGAFDRKAMDTTLSALRNRVFLLHNVHAAAPIVFETRWVLSYLRGPLTREQIQRLEQGAKPTDPPPPPIQPETHETAPTPARTTTSPTPASPRSSKPVLPPGVPEAFLRPLVPTPAADGPTVFHPTLLTTARARFIDRKVPVDQWKSFLLTLPIHGSDWPADPWTDLQITVDPHPPALEPDLDALRLDPSCSVEFAPIPADLTRPKNYTAWTRALKDQLYREATLEFWTCPDLDLYSLPEEREEDFRLRARMKSRELRDAAVDDLRAKFRPKLDALEAKVRQAQEKVDREKAQATQSTFDAAVSFGGSVLDALLRGGKRTSRTRGTTAARSASKAVRQRSEAAAAAESLQSLRLQRADLDEDFAAAVRRIESDFSAHALEIKPYRVSPRKSEIRVEPLQLVWSPEPGVEPSSDEIRHL
jgi:hypothetical protein